MEKFIAVLNVEYDASQKDFTTRSKKIIGDKINNPNSIRDSLSVEGFITIDEILEKIISICQEVASESRNSEYLDEQYEYPELIFYREGDEFEHYLGFPAMVNGLEKWLLSPDPEKYLRDREIDTVCIWILAEPDHYTQQYKNIFRGLRVISKKDYVEIMI